MRKNFNLISNQMGYNTVVHTLTEDQLSLRYFKGSRNSAAVTVQEY